MEQYRAWIVHAQAENMRFQYATGERVLSVLEMGAPTAWRTIYSKTIATERRDHRASRWRKRQGHCRLRKTPHASMKLAPLIYHVNNCHGVAEEVARDACHGFHNAGDLDWGTH